MPGEGAPFGACQKGEPALARAGRDGTCRGGSASRRERGEVEARGVYGDAEGMDVSSSFCSSSNRLSCHTRTRG